MAVGVTVGVAVGVAVVVGVAVGVGVAVEQTQLVSSVQEGFTQVPFVAPFAKLQVSPDGHSESEVHLLPHSGTGVGVGVAIAKDRLQVVWAAACGLLAGALGETLTCLN